MNVLSGEAETVDQRAIAELQAVDVSPEGHAGKRIA